MNKIIMSIFVVLLSLLTNQNTSAMGIPEEPMTIYGSIAGSFPSGSTITIFDGEDNIVHTSQLRGNMFWTNETFDIENKITLSSFSGALRFEVDGDMARTILLGWIGVCNTVPTFQPGLLCEYDLELFETVEQSDVDDTITLSGSRTNFDDLRTSFIPYIRTISSEIDDVLISRDGIDFDDLDTLDQDLIIVPDSSDSTTLSHSIFIPRTANTIESDVLIWEPRQITTLDTVKNRIPGVTRVFGAIEIPTNKAVNFTDTIRVCLNVSQVVTNRNIYFSQDNVTWTRDTSVSRIQTDGNTLCFSTDHLTSFAVAQQDFSITGGSSAPWIDNCPGGDNSWYRYDGKCEASESSVAKNTTVIKEEVKVDAATEWTQVEQKSQSSKAISFSDYKRWVQSFNTNRKLVVVLSGMDVISIDGDTEYSEKLVSFAKRIRKDIKRQNLRDDLINYLNRATMSYGVYTDETIDQELRNQFKQKYKRDIQNFTKKYSIIQKKDTIISRFLSQ